MTALAAAPPVAVRPVAWRRLAWVAWRRYRLTLVSTAVLLVVLGVDLFVKGHQARAAYDAVRACTPSSSAQCRFLDQNFNEKYGAPGFLGPVLVLLPGLLGAFAGAPLLARELETGTFRYAWTQGVGRMRWAVALLVPGAIGLAVLVAAFGALSRWRSQPLVDYGASSRLETWIFATTGLAVAGWTLLGFALGALAGLLWRRVLPAIATAFAVWFGLAFLATDVLRHHYVAPLSTTSQRLPSGAFVIGQWWTKDGNRVSDAAINQRLESLGASVSGHGVQVHVAPGGVDPFQYLTQHGYSQVSSYQPDSRYWTFQWIEFGWLTALAVALLAVTFWLLRRRAA